MQPPIPELKIAPIDQGSPVRIPDEIPEEPLPNPTLKFTINENIKMVINALQTDKGKKPMTAGQQAFHSGTPLKQKHGWSQDEINQALEDSIWIQALKHNPDLMRGISPICHEGFLKAQEIVSCLYYNLPSHDSDQLDLPLSP